MQGVVRLFRHSFLREVRTVLALAVPVALAELGWVSMSVVDTVMVGDLGPEAIGAIAIGSSAFYAFGIFGLGLMLGLDTLVSRAFGAGDRHDCHRSLAAGIYLAAILAPLLMVLFWLMPTMFDAAAIQPRVSVPAAVFLRTLSFSTLPLLLYGAFRRYLQATGLAGPVTFALVSANLVNWLCNWILIYGNWGAPALGVKGSAVATVIARLYMATLLGVSIWYFEHDRVPSARDIVRRPDWPRLALLIRLGFPAAMQILLEVGAFGATAFLAGRLAAVALAAHQIAVNVASVSYMVPLGISSAAAVTVGHALGKDNPALARYHGFIALGIAVAFELCSAAVLLLFPRQILQLYTNDGGVIETGIALLGLAAAFQLFDGLQAVATGALRGLGNTRTAMLVNLCGYWVLGLPLGYVLCFRNGYGVFGLWIGLTLALIVIAVILSLVWQRVSRASIFVRP